MRSIVSFLAYLGVVATLLISLFCVGLGLLGGVAGGEMFVDLLPVAPERQATALVAVGAFGLLAALLALRPGRWRNLPLLAWSLGLLAVVASTVFRSGYRYDGVADLKAHGWLALGAAVLSLVAWRRSRRTER